MIMYTRVPLEEVFEGIENMTDDLQEIELNGVTMQVKWTGASQAQIVRLISPNPQDYLQPSYAPGNFIQFQPRA